MPLLESLRQLRQQFLTEIKSNVLFERDFTEKLKNALERGLFPGEQTGTVNVADVSNYVSARIGWEWGRRLPGDYHDKKIKGQTAGDRFTSIVRNFLEHGIEICGDLRKTDWRYSLSDARASKNARYAPKNPRIAASEFAQYAHLSAIKETFDRQPELEAVFGSDYIVEPDIVIFSHPFDVSDVGGRPQDPVATFSPLLLDAEYGFGKPLLHASVSCKLTIRSDRAQNARLEALNLIRTRKGRVPNITFVTAEPLPSRLSSLALGTGDVDCIYHAGLHELVQAVDDAINFGMKGALPEDLGEVTSRDLALVGDGEGNLDAGAAEATPTKRGLERQRDRLNTMIRQGRLRDVSDLVLDLLA